ncbi:MAG: cation diffusion facilitator family transporter [Beijerinckiaceae bacterium]
MGTDHDHAHKPTAQICSHLDSDGHSHGHTHEHGHGHQPGHSHARDADEKRLLIALALTGGFMIAEVVGGLLSGSLALIADAGHMATDAAALALAWISARMARKPATVLRSYGHHRAQVLAAFMNGAALIGLSLWIVVEAVRRFLDPVEVLGGPMLVIALVGLAVNVAAFFALQGGNRENLNMRGALLHVIGDMLGSAAAIVAALVILVTGWAPIDPLLSIVVSLLIVRSAWGLARSSWDVLMEGAPRGFDMNELVQRLMAAAPGVLDIHHVHVWALTPEKPLITLHARLRDGVSDEETLRNLHGELASRFGLTHATIQLERGPCPENGASRAP